MLKKYFWLWFIFIATTAPGQERRLRRFTALVDFSGGINYTLKGIHSNQGTDDLIFFNGNNTLADFSGAIFMNEKWGLCLNYQIKDNDSKKYSNFDHLIENQYPSSAYNINYSSSTFNTADVESEFPDPSETVTAGLVYNFGKHKIRFIPKLAFGGTYFKSINRYVDIKRKNSNEYIQQYFYQNSSDYSHYVFTVNTGFSLVYLFYRGIGVNFQANYYQTFLPSGALKYTITTENSLTGQIKKSFVNYKQVTGQISLSIGFNFYIRFYKKDL